MAISSSTNGTSSQTSGGAEQTQASLTTAGFYQYWVDLSLLANAATPDLVILRLYSQISAGGGYLLEDTHTYIGAQTSKFWRSKPYPNLYGIRLTIEQPQGTARALPWVAATW